MGMWGTIKPRYQVCREEIENVGCYKPQVCMRSKAMKLPSFYCDVVVSTPREDRGSNAGGSRKPKQYQLDSIFWELNICAAPI